MTRHNPVAGNLPTSERWASKAARLLGGLLAAVLFSSCQFPAERTDLPERMVWAWRRPEALGFLGPETGIAAWMGTIHLEGADLRLDFREWPLSYREGAYLAAVVRLESGAAPPPTYSAEQRKELTDLLVDLWRRTGWPELQLDFDARRSERPFYRALLSDLDRAAPEARLSITALLSWCWESEWLDTLPVDEVVPMIYRLGLEGDDYRRRLAEGASFQADACERAVAVSSDEEIPEFSHLGRLYLFHHGSWTEERFLQQLERADRALGRKDANDR